MKWKIVAKSLFQWFSHDEVSAVCRLADLHERPAVLPRRAHLLPPRRRLRHLPRHRRHRVRLVVALQLRVVVLVGGQHSLALEDVGSLLAGHMLLRGRGGGEEESRRRRRRRRGEEEEEVERRRKWRGGGIEEEKCSHLLFPLGSTVLEPDLYLLLRDTQQPGRKNWRERKRQQLVGVVSKYQCGGKKSVETEVLKAGDANLSKTA